MIAPDALPFWFVFPAAIVATVAYLVVEIRSRNSG